MNKYKSKNKINNELALDIRGGGTDTDDNKESLTDYGPSDSDYMPEEAEGDIKKNQVRPS